MARGRIMGFLPAVAATAAIQRASLRGRVPCPRLLLVRCLSRRDFGSGVCRGQGGVDMVSPFVFARRTPVPRVFFFRPSIFLASPWLKIPRQRLDLAIPRKLHRIAFPVGVTLVTPGRKQVGPHAPRHLVFVANEPVVSRNVEITVSLSAVRATTEILVRRNIAHGSVLAFIVSCRSMNTWVPSCRSILLHGGVDGLVIRVFPLPMPS